ncbi:MAG TPA: CPBP family intramembrane glutamic endopeptidase [Rhizomicrobium sp.]|jgi:membrane protease YdiL (CAAX protease family)
MTMTYSDQPKPGAIRTLAKALISGAAIAVTGLGIWGALGTTALRHSDFLPWLAPAMGAVLALGAAYLKWGKWPRAGAAFRNHAVRLNRVAAKPFLFALAAGWSTMLTGLCLYAAYRVLTGMGGELTPMSFPHLPIASLLPGLFMAACVAAVVEEIAFRGLMQGTLERRFGAISAILVSGFAWAMFHTNHAYYAEDALFITGMFLSVAAMLGTIARRTDSVIPGIVVHTGFDFAYFLAAALLVSKGVAPIAWVQLLATPQELFVAAAIFAGAMLMSWGAFFRATR